MRDNWETGNIGEACEILDNRRKPITKKDRVEGDYPYYGATGILSYVEGYIFDEKLVLLGEDGAKWESGDNSAFIINGKTWVNNHAHVLRPNRKVLLDEWLVYSLNFQNLMAYVSGMTVPKLNQGNMKKIQIPIPPIQEQKEIVEILDQAFESIEKAKANIEKNIENAKELFQSKLNQIFSQTGNDWKETTLGAVTTLFQGLAINKKTQHLLVQKSSLPLLRIKDLKNNTVSQYITESGFPINSLVNREEIIFTRTGSLGLVFRGKKGVLHNNSFKVVPDDSLTNDYLFWWLQHPAFTKKIIALSSKAAQPDITHKLFKQQTIRYPEKAIQIKCFNEIEILNNHIQSVLLVYKEELKNLEEFKKSILQKAFSGELTNKNKAA